MRSTVKYIGLIFLLLGLTKATAQDLCESTLAKAQEEFNAGHFHSIPAILKECLDQNDNREWQQRAYLLMAETYLLLDDPFGADESYLRVLKANPEFLTSDKRDPIDLVYLSKKFTSTPIFTVYGKVGPNTSPVRIIHNVSISGESHVSEKYVLRVGWQLGIGLDWNYNERIALATELNYTNTAFKHQTKDLFAAGQYSVEYNDRQTWLSVPLIAKYGDDKGVFRPYGYMGYALNLLVNDKGVIVVEGDVESPILDFTHKRNLVNTSFIVGGGIKYKWNLTYFFADVRYGVGLSNIVNPVNRYDQFNLDWPYVDDDFRMDNLSVSFGYVYPFYKPRKLKRAKTRSVLRKIEKNDEGN